MCNTQKFFVMKLRCLESSWSDYHAAERPISKERKPQLRRCRNLGTSKVDIGRYCTVFTNKVDRL